MLIQTMIEDPRESNFSLCSLFLPSWVCCFWIHRTTMNQWSAFLPGSWCFKMPCWGTPADRHAQAGLKAWPRRKGDPILQRAAPWGAVGWKNDRCSCYNRVHIEWICTPEVKPTTFTVTGSTEGQISIRLCHFHLTVLQGSVAVRDCDRVAEARCHENTKNKTKEINLPRDTEETGEPGPERRRTLTN